METNRLIIRNFEFEDWKDLYEYLSDEEVVKFEPYEAVSIIDCKKEIVRRSKSNNFKAVVLKSENKLIGNIYISLIEPIELMTWELGFVFNKKYWKNGYAYESSLSIISDLFQNCNAHRIIAKCNPENINSWRLLEKLNFRKEAHFVKNIYFRKKDNIPIWQDTYEYALLQTEFNMYYDW